MKDKVVSDRVRERGLEEGEEKKGEGRTEREVCASDFLFFFFWL